MKRILKIILKPQLLIAFSLVLMIFSLGIVGSILGTGGGGSGCGGGGSDNAELTDENFNSDAETNHGDESGKNGNGKNYSSNAAENDVFIPSEISYEGLQQIYNKSRCSQSDIGGYSHYQCMAYFDYLDKFISINLDPDGCRTVQWQTDPNGEVEKSTPGNEIVFIDLCNLNCSNDYVRKQIIDPETPLCDLRGLFVSNPINTKLRQNDRVVFRRGSIRYFSFPDPAGVDIYDTSQISNHEGRLLISDSKLQVDNMFSSYISILPPVQETVIVDGVTEKKPHNIIFEAYPGDEGLVTIQYARSNYYLNKNGEWILFFDKNEGSKGILFSGFNTEYDGLSFRNLRFLGSIDIDEKIKRYGSIPDYFPTGRYYGNFAVSLSGANITSHNTEYLWNEGFDVFPPVTKELCSTLNTKKSPAYCQKTLEVNEGAPGGYTFAADGAHNLKMTHSKIVCTRNIPKEVTPDQLSYGNATIASDGMKPYDASNWSFEDSYFGDCTHISLDTGRVKGSNKYIKNIFHNRLHTAAVVGGDVIFDQNIVYGTGKNTPFYPFNILQTFGSSGKYTNNVLIASGNVKPLDYGGVVFINTKDLLIENNFIYNEAGKGSVSVTFWWSKYWVQSNFPYFPSKGSNNKFRNNTIVGFSGLRHQNDGLLSFIDSDALVAESGTIDNIINDSGIEIQDNEFYLPFQMKKTLFAAVDGGSCMCLFNEKTLDMFPDWANNTFSHISQPNNLEKFVNLNLDTDWSFLLGKLNVEEDPTVLQQQIDECKKQKCTVLGETLATGYCGDGMCNGAETMAMCPSDCVGATTTTTTAVTGYCGDGLCTAPETMATCPSDCSGATTATATTTVATDYCGDGICNGAETMAMCQSDCVGATTTGETIGCNSQFYWFCGNQSNCENVGAKWCGTSATDGWCFGTGTVCPPTECDAANYWNCKTESACTGAGLYWNTNISMCSSILPPQCTANELYNCYDVGSCSGADGSWCNNNTCQATCPECSSSQLWNCYNSVECTVAGGNWCTPDGGNGWCWDTCPSTVCDIDNLWNCKTEADCITLSEGSQGATYYWENNYCYMQPPS